jgi:hypothetical protein
LVEQFRSHAQRNRIIALFIILGVIVVAISVQLKAWDEIISFYKHHLHSDTKSEHVILFPKTELTYIPKIGETPVSPLRLGLTFWNCNERVFDISVATVELLDSASNSYVQIGATVTDKDGAPIALPLVFSPNQKEDLIFNFQPASALPEDFKLRITTYTHETSDKLVAAAEFKRLTNGYEASLDVNGKYLEFGHAYVSNAISVNVSFLRPLKTLKNYPIISTQTEPRYNGEWKNGQAKGHGIYTWPDGSKYDGQWKDGKADGYGIRILVSGERYDGEWRNGQQEGQGVNIWPDGSRYTGQWVNGKCEGSGIMTHTNGEKYDGEWKAGYPQGHGILTKQDGSAFEGIWQNGSLSVASTNFIRPQN